MGRYVSLYIAPTVNLGLRAVSPGFGSGSFQFFGSSGTFTIPTGTASIRVTALGPGGAGCCFTGRCNCACMCFCDQNWVVGNGGGGGGYVVATVDVTPGTVCTITVGAACGAASCMGSQVVAFGGCPGCNSDNSCAFNGFGSNCAGQGGGYCVGTGATLILGYCGNRASAQRTLTTACGNNTVVVNCNCSQGGASGSQIGGNGCGAFPGTSCADVFTCKAFNGEDLSETDTTTKFSNTIRWPGEAILSTSRLATTIAGTAPGYPPGCYKVTAFGGATLISGCCGCCQPCFNAGCGGGAAGSTSRGGIMCCFNSGYVQCRVPGSPSSTSGDAGAGYVVIEY